MRKKRKRSGKERTSCHPETRWPFCAEKDGEKLLRKQTRAKRRSEPLWSSRKEIGVCSVAIVEASDGEVVVSVLVVEALPLLRHLHHHRYQNLIKAVGPACGTSPRQCNESSVDSAVKLTQTKKMKGKNKEEREEQRRKGRTKKKEKATETAREKKKANKREAEADLVSSFVLFEFL
jgi:hypothetical protein